MPCCDYFSYVGITVTSEGAAFSPASRRPKPLKVPLADGTSHFFILDMTKPSTVFILPFVLNAWRADHVTVLLPQDWQQGKSYAFRIDSPDTRPKGVPTSDVAYHLDGPLGVTVWVDPSTLIADRIDWPSAQTTLIRKGMKY